MMCMIFSLFAFNVILIHFCRIFIPFCFSSILNVLVMCYQAVNRQEAPDFNLFFHFVLFMKNEQLNQELRLLLDGIKSCDIIKTGPHRPCLASIAFLLSSERVLCIPIKYCSHHIGLVRSRTTGNQQRRSLGRDAWQIPKRVCGGGQELVKGNGPGSRMTSCLPRSYQHSECYTLAWCANIASLEWCR